MPAARSQPVTVRRPAARTAPRKRRTRRGAERMSSSAAREENQGHGAGAFGDNGMAGPSVVRGGLATAIVPEGPALVYSPTSAVGNAESRGKYSHQDYRLSTIARIIAAGSTYSAPPLRQGESRA